jgi:hypothetical protein
MCGHASIRESSPRSVAQLMAAFHPAYILWFGKLELAERTRRATR